MNDLGKIIKKARENARLTQRQLAEKTGLATVTIGQYERGGRNPGGPQLQLLADALGVSVQIFSPQFWEAPYIPDPTEQYIPGVDDEEDDESLEIQFGPNLSENIRIARKAAGLTQTQLAEQTGVALGTIQQYESGRRRRPRIQHLQRLAEVFGVSVYELAPRYQLTQTDDEDEATEKTKLDIERADLGYHHRNQWLYLMTQDGKETRYLHSRLNDVLYDMTPEAIELVTDFAEFMKQREAEYLRKNVL